MDQNRESTAGRSLETLQRLLDIPAADLRTALTHAANALADVLGADKVDAFLYDEKRDSLVAEGVSTQPLSDLQKKLGLDVLPISNGGRVVDVYVTGQVFRTGDLLNDPEELRGIKEGMKIQSKLGVPLEVGGRRVGMVMIASLQPDFFTAADESFARSAVGWVGMVAHRALLSREMERNALEEGRRTAAEEIVTACAHDIRNYVSPVLLRLHALRLMARRDEREEYSREIEAGLRSLSRLNALVSNLLNVSRIDRGLFELDLEPVDLTALAQDAAAELSTTDNPIVVEASGPMLVSADPVRLRQCLDNLLSNAVGYSPPGATVDVFIRSSVRDAANWVQVEVIDQGPGITDEMLPRVFERFATGRQRDGGMGIGLYLAKRIALAHGGDIAAERNPGQQGARFVVRIPLVATLSPEGR